VKCGGVAVMDSFSVQVVHADARTILRLRGALDMATASQVDVGLALALERTPRGGCLVLDAHELDFCDVVGLHGLLAARAAAADRGCVFVLRGPSAMLRRLIVAAELSETLLAGATQIDIGARERPGGAAGLASSPVSRGSGIPTTRDEIG
jgi:anti-anti-sigma factor